jgi:hypothetical protein
VAKEVKRLEAEEAAARAAELAAAEAAESGEDEEAPTGSRYGGAPAAAQQRAPAGRAAAPAPRAPAPSRGAAGKAAHVLAALQDSPLALDLPANTRGLDAVAALVRAMHPFACGLWRPQASPAARQAHPIISRPLRLSKRGRASPQTA